MPPHMVSQTLAFFSFVLILVLIHIPKFDCANVDSRYANCSHTFECLGHLNLTYPFWGSNRPNYCGHPAFELNCIDDDPLISIESVDYRVLELNQSKNTLVVARDDYWENLCPKEFHNTTLDSSIFSFASDSQNLTLYYECSPRSVPLASVPSLFNCHDWFNYFFVIASDVSPPICHEMIVLRISNSVVGKITNNASLVPALKSGFGLNWKLNVSTYCDECIAAGGYCGSDQNTGQFTCYCMDGPQSTNCSNSTSGISSERNLFIGLSVIILGSIIISSVIIYHCKRKRNKTNTFDVEKLITNFGSFAPKRYNYFNVKKITNSFAERIGEGGFGTVYKGKLSDGHLVAVKVLNDSKHNGEDFINEVASIGRCSHVNIVTLLGFCHERSKSALIYEYMPNGSLDKFIFGDQGCMNTNRSLQWRTLYEITIGIARGLEYLHSGCNTGILHFDIKPQNILLDEKFCPKISDFGLAKLWIRQEGIMSMIGTRGTIGYIAPEVFNRNFGVVSHKSDVYSYGMLVLEIVGGRKNVDARVSHTSQIYYPHWIYNDIESNKDLRIEGITSGEDKEIAKKMILTSFWCIQTRPSDRPSMSKVVEMLEGSSELLQIPPKPFLYSPKRSTLQSTPLEIEEVS